MIMIARNMALDVVVLTCPPNLVFETEGYFIEGEVKQRARMI